MIQFPQKSDATTWHPIDLGTAGGFEVEVKKPTAQQILRDSELYAGFMLERVRTCVVGWRGVQDNGADVPFTMDKFMELGCAVPTVLQQVSDLARGLFCGIGDMPSKNSAGPSSSG